MRAMILATVFLLLSACASFGQPTLHETLTEQQRCADSWACRTFITDRPLVLVAAMRDTPADTRCALAAAGIGGYQHGPYVIASVDGRQYALGYSWTCRGICSMTEAQHSMDKP